MELLMEYDRSKADPKCKECKRFYKRLDDAADDIKNVVQITPHKAMVTIKEEFLDVSITKEAIEK